MFAPAIVEGFRLSPQQRRLWMLQEASTPGASQYRSQLVLLLEGELRIDELRAALESVCARHEALRSTFSRLQGVVMPIQSVTDLAVSWRTVDLSGGTSEWELEELLTLERRNEFDVEYGPLVHATMYVLSPVRHVFSITVPSLNADSRTLINLFTELSQTYAGTTGDDEPFQYLQFAEWQNTLAGEPDANEAKEYWSRQDLGAASTVSLPRQQPSRTRGELHSVKLSLNAETAAQVAVLADRYETTSGNVLLAAWQTLLWRLARRPIVVGKISDGRTYELLHDAFGLYARALPVQCRFSDGLSFAEVVEQTGIFEVEATEWQDYFEFNADGIANHFSFGYEYTEWPIERNERGLQISVFRLYSSIERFNLKLSSVSKKTDLELEFEYDEAAFSEANVRQLAGQFETLLNVALANPAGLVDDFEIVSDAEREQILFTWNQTQRDYPLDHCIHQLFEEQVKRTPNAIAAVFKDRQLTFQQLNQRANQLARYLQRNGVVPDTPVGLCVESSIEMIVGVMGILKSGGAYLPLDPRNPDKRINQVLKDAGVKLLLTQSNLSAKQIDPDIQSIQLDADWKTKIATESAENLFGRARANNLAYVIYTSGSTGEPKGVMIQHASAVNLANGLREKVYNGLGPALKVGLSAPLAFDASVKQWLQLLSGHTLYLLPEELRLDAVQLLAYLDHHSLDVIDCTPSQMKLLLAAGFGESNWNRPKMVLIGGEAVDESLWSQLAAIKGTCFQDVYGPTECTVDTTWATVDADAECPTIGRPLPNVQAYVLDKNLKPAGVQIVGELYVGGAGVGRGYLNRPELTAGRFVPDFVSGKEGARLYRTGDLARYLPDGSIEFLGRNDSQVKVRGHRIELGEIEAVVRQHEQVRQVVVVAREDRTGEQRLVAYVVPKESGKLDVTEVRRMVSERLPDYMGLSFVVPMDQLPLTRNGKVDVNALPKPETVLMPSVERYIAPRNEIEQTITNIWQEALGVEHIGVNDNFFEVGGHSLLMVQVHSKLSELFDSKLSIAEMFAKPTISALAEHFGNGNGHKAGLQKAITRAERRKQGNISRAKAQRRKESH